MSMCYWGIQGYAIEYDESWLRKDLEEGECTCDELFDLIVKDNHLDCRDWTAFTPINWATDGDCTEWIIYTPNAYFNMHPLEKTFTCQDDIAQAMYQLLRPYLKETITAEFFVEALDYVDTYGCG